MAHPNLKQPTNQSPFTGPTHARSLSQPVSFANNCLPPLSPLPPTESSIVSSNNSNPRDLFMDDMDVSSRDSPAVAPNFPFQTPNVLPPRRGHRRSSSDSIPLELSRNSQPVELRMKETGCHVKSEGEVVDELVNSLMSLDHLSSPSPGDNMSGVMIGSMNQVLPLARHCRSLSMDSGVGKFGLGDDSGIFPALDCGREASQLSPGLEFGRGEFSEADLKKIMTDERLAEIAVSDPKRAKRILANRQSAARSKERKVRYISELEHKVQTLQTEATTLSAQVTILQKEYAELTSQNNELKFRVQAMEQQAHIRDALHESLTAEVQHLKLREERRTSNGMGHQMNMKHHVFQIAPNQIQQIARLFVFLSKSELPPVNRLATLFLCAYRLLATAVELSWREMEEEKKVEEVQGGELLFCGTTAWDAMGRRRTAPEENLVSPTRIRPLMGIDIRFVASGCVSCHCVALDVDGRCYTWGRNEARWILVVKISVLVDCKGQLGHGDRAQRDRPTIVSELSQYKVVRAGAGRSHSVVVTEDGFSFAFGWNKHGQLGSGSAKNEVESSPVSCQVSDVKSAVCGGDFTVWLTSVEGSSILTAGLPQYGQLGHGTDNEYNTKDSSVKLAYEAQSRPKAIASLAGETIVKVACGTNHTVAVDKNGHVYTWGFGGYGRLGHREQKDEWVPRLVDVFTRHNVLPPDAVVSAGSANSACTAECNLNLILRTVSLSALAVLDVAFVESTGAFAGGGQLYMWGKIKNSGDDWMYPKPLMDLSGWHLRCMDSGNAHHFVGADSSCISWGHAQSGELGYGPNGQKSSAIPKKVDILEGMHVISVACGLALSLVVVDRTKNAKQLEELEVYDGKAAAEVTQALDEKPAAAAKRTPTKKPQNANKRKKGGESSSEDEANSEYESEESDEMLNGYGKGGKSTGKGRAQSTGKKGSGRGRGRPPSGTKSTEASGGKGTGKRGRPKKS
ncbi:regulator of chromosome condensation family protein [Striga asiatica]|uniref:Regulator of chromosome condensation family protein n=1 Tax=Striga asiatica TaxID=4170 RepID=A0A5A7RIU6_STRAF|nr:regulator of chromosome condensation family protein [Striga asiatica]